mgnify:CR=1 FL=1|jgi:hypothetical protein
MKNLIFSLFVFVQTFVFSQRDLHSYRYIIVPEQFYFLDAPDQYQLNSMAKFLLEKKGFLVFGAHDAIPENLAMSNCEGLFFKLEKDSNLFQTKLQFTLLDCHRKKVFESDLGVSREKEYRKAYQESLRKTFETVADRFDKHQTVAQEYTKTLPLDLTLIERKNNRQAMYVNSKGMRIELKANQKGYQGFHLQGSANSGVSDKLICRLFKTSLPNVFQVVWYDFSGKILQTVGYFDNEENLNIDFETEAGLSVTVFERMH